MLSNRFLKFGCTKRCMVERTLVPLVIGMMVIAGLYGFDQYYENAGISGNVVYNADSVGDCRDTDNGDIYVTGVAISEFADLEETDRCVGDDLIEYYCSDHGFDTAVVTCRDGCDAGSCR